MWLVGISARRSEQTAQDGADLRHPRSGACRFGGAQTCGGPSADALAEEGLGAADVFDDPLVARARIGREGEKPVLEEHHAFGVGLSLEDLLGGERLQLAQPAQPAEVERREAFGLDGVQVPSASLDAESFDAVSEQVLL